MVEIGDEILFEPAAFMAYEAETWATYGAVRNVRGTVVQIHEEHRWYRVAYTLPGSATLQHECFKF